MKMFLLIISIALGIASHAQKNKIVQSLPNVSLYNIYGNTYNLNRRASNKIIIIDC